MSAQGRLRVGLVGDRDGGLAALADLLEANGVDIVPVSASGADRTGLTATVAEPEATAQLARAKDRFLELVSHELNTPLTSVLGFSSTLSARWDEISGDDKLAYVETIRKKARELARMVDQMITLASIDAGLLVPRRQQIALPAVLAKLAHGHHIAISCPEDLTAWADPEHVGRILEIFLDNAMRHGEPPIEVVAGLVGASVEVEVRDSGPGVQREFMPSLLERFGQASTGLNRTSRGLGLGLALAQDLARQLAAVIWYEPAANGGACFGLRLPSRRGRAGLPDMLVSHAATLATANGHDEESAVGDLVHMAEGDGQAVDDARRQSLLLGMKFHSCRMGARLLSKAKAEIAG